MIHFVVFVFVCLLAASRSFVFHKTRAGRTSHKIAASPDPMASPASHRIAPVREDMEKLAIMLANITEYLDTQPEKAMTIASKDMAWLYQRDVPKLTQMLLNEVPAVRQDNAMMRAYMFLIDFLEAVGKETTAMLKQNQETFRKLLEAAKASEKALDAHIAANTQKVTISS